MKRTWGLLKKKIATIEKLNNALSMQLPPNSNHIIEINKGRKTMDGWMVTTSWWPSGFH